MAPYYYAGGRKIELELDREHAAVPLDEARRLGVSLPDDRRELPGDLALVRQDELSPPERASLERAGAMRQVYNYRGTLMVPLPEVRVELEGDQRVAVLSAIAHAKVKADIDESTPGRLLVRLESNLGDDALAQDNTTTERANPALSSARMVQVTARPDVRTRPKR